jgi:hypothetical protein
MKKQKLQFNPMHFFAFLPPLCQQHPNCARARITAAAAAVVHCKFFTIVVAQVNR